MSLSLLLTFVFLQLIIQTCSRADGASIRPGSSSLVAGPNYIPNGWFSESKQFAFGFYPQGTTGYVVAIWLIVIEENPVVVWTACRDDPPVSPNATLQLTHEGELVVISGLRRVKIIAVDNISYAVMNDTGNFILYNHTGGVAWQSFDHPTDSMLPGQRLLVGSKLVSSVSKTNYSSGRYLMKVWEDGNIVMFPVNLQEGRLNQYGLSDTSGYGNESYLYLNTTGSLAIVGSNSSADPPKYLYNEQSDSDVMYRATLGDDGVFRLFSYSSNDSSPFIVWKNPDNPCIVKTFCGFNSYCTMNDEQPYCRCLPGSDFIDVNITYSGCERNFIKATTCISGKENETYYKMVAQKQLMVDDHSYYQFYTIKKEECSDSCLKDCDCDAALFQDKVCSVLKYPFRYVRREYNNDRITAFFKTISRQVNESVNVNSVEGGTTSKKTWVLIILVLSIGFSIYSCISLSFSGFFIFKFRLLKYKRLLLESGNLGFAEDLILRSFTYDDLRKATNGFKQQLGRGSFGTVYKGFLGKGKKPIAVKRLEKVVDEGEREFRAEMQVIGKTHHKNLVRLLGYCAEGKTHRLLVYEYMSNGTLSERLFKSARLPDWSERVQLALDVARGMVYLHEECETPIIHCDIKPQNILMDDFWTAKISDFGMAKLMKPDQTKTFTIVRGTRGYLAPEWQKNTPISLKVDVFSYGIVLLEIICCRRNLDVQVSNPDEIVLSNWVYKCFERGQLGLLVDDEEAKETLERLVKVGLWCVQDDPTLRPSMKCVLLMLEGITDIATPPCPISNW